MNLRKKLLSTAAAAALGLAGLIGAAAPAHAANTTPADLYYPSGGCSSGAAGQKFVDSNGSQITGALFGADGDQVTIHNQCTATNIYIYYGQAGAYALLAAQTNATYTLTNNVATVIASDSDGGNQWATISVQPLPDVTATGSNASTTISPTSLTAPNGSTFTLQNSGSDSLAVYGVGGALARFGIPCTAANPCSVSSGLQPQFTVVAQGTVRVGSATLTIGSGGGGGDSSSASASAPQTFELSLTPTDGTTCTNSSESGTAGTWMTLPGANDCTPPTAQANANLLGWATTPNFPVDIAKRQVDNGWGAYEIFNEEGQLTAVFIPAGGSTFLSGSGQLYPIWSE